MQVLYNMSSDIFLYQNTWTSTYATCDDERISWENSFILSSDIPVLFSFLLLFVFFDNDDWWRSTIPGTRGHFWPSALFMLCGNVFWCVWKHLALLWKCQLLIIWYQQKLCYSNRVYYLISTFIIGDYGWFGIFLLKCFIVGGFLY